MNLDRVFQTFPQLETARASWQQGMMTEALEAVIGFEFRQVELNRIQAVVMPGNVGSERLLEKLGFQREGILLVLICWVPELLLSYLKVSPTGLEVRYWPFYRLCVRWDEVDRIDKHRIFGVFPSDALYLKQAAPFGSCSILGRELWLWPRLDQRLVVLNDFGGWPKGRLAEDLRLYIPHAVELEDKR